VFPLSERLSFSSSFRVRKRKSKTNDEPTQRVRRAVAAALRVSGIGMRLAQPRGPVTVRARVLPAVAMPIPLTAKRAATARAAR